MRVLLIGPMPPPVNGVSFANATLTKKLEERAISVDIINTSADTLSSKQGTSFSFSKALSFFHTYFKVFRIFSNDIIYTTPGQTFFGILKYAPFYLLAWLLGKPYIIHLHGNYLGKEYNLLKGIKKKLFYFFISRASAGIALSGSLVKNFADLLPRERVYVVENFVTDDLLQPLTSKPSDKLRVIFLSNLMKEKGILDLLDALSILKDKGIDFSATLAGALEQGLEELIEEKFLTISENTTYLQTVSGPRKRQALQEANVFVLPTYYIMEGQPISLLEGLATGNINVSTAHAGIPDVADTSNGYFVAPQAPHELAAVLEKISRNIDSEVERFSLRNQQHAASLFTEQRFVDRIIEIFKAVKK